GNFLAKLPIAIAIAVLAWFTTVQFAKARRVQESYAFKGTVASSFDAYRSLVEEIAKDPELKERPEYAKFITETIRDLYDAPNVDKEGEDVPPPAQLMKGVTEILKQVGVIVSKKL
ncbi:MAG: hypothetical protein IID33_13175, partial [Planctomycetes bacterium]|nr:hypothetical protein [Planctomycetota bacterium]